MLEGNLNWITNGYARAVTQATITGIAAGVASHAVSNSKAGLSQIAADAFGNALGSSLVDLVKKTSNAEMSAQALSGMANDGRDYIYDSLAKAGVSAEKIQQIRGDSAFNGRLEEIVGFAKLQQELGGRSSKS
jgi:flagellar hook-basal body complex protein FliE